MPPIPISSSPSPLLLLCGPTPNPLPSFSSGILPRSLSQVSSRGTPGVAIGTCVVSMAALSLVVLLVRQPFQVREAWQGTPEVGAVSIA